MGKHDIKDKVIAASSDEFARNEVKALRKNLAEKDAELAFANETIKKLQEMCSRMSRYASEMEADRDAIRKEKDERIAFLQGAMSRMAEKIYGVQVS